MSLYKELVQEARREILWKYVNRHDGNFTAASKELGIERSDFLKMIHGTRKSRAKKSEAA